ncbi:MAG TPA: choice-of-anchor D domain-containing protein, partial [Geobacteraceae bacterium]
MRRFPTMVSFLAALIIFCSSMGSAHAVMKAVGPTDPVNHFPVWYEDANDLALQLCLDTNGFCSLPAGGGFNSGNPVVFPTNFPTSAPYWQAQSNLATTGTPATLRMALEASFLGPVQDGNQVTSLLITLGEMTNLPANVTCTVTHPFGTFSFATDGAGNSPNVNQLAFQASDPVTPQPGIFNAFVQPGGSSANTAIGPFLRTTTGFVTAPNGSAYLANPVTPVQVTGSPTGTNLFRIDCPGIGGVGVNSVQTNLFNLTGKAMPLQVADPAAGTDFGPVKLNATVPARSFTVTNVSGLAITPTMTSSNPAFAVSAGSCGSSVAAGATCTFDVTFTPTADGPQPGTISVGGTGLPAMTASVSGIGDGIPPSIDITTISRFTPAIIQNI